jgi:hypothetical protein
VIGGEPADAQMGFHWHVNLLELDVTAGSPNAGSNGAKLDASTELRARTWRRLPNRRVVLALRRTTDLDVSLDVHGISFSRLIWTLLSIDQPA